MNLLRTRSLCPSCPIRSLCPSCPSRSLERGFMTGSSFNSSLFEKNLVFNPCSIPTFVRWDPIQNSRFPRVKMAEPFHQPAPIFSPTTPIFINHPPYSSITPIFINIHQSLRIFINHPPYSSITPNIHLSSPTFINYPQYSSTITPYSLTIPHIQQSSLY